MDNPNFTQAYYWYYATKEEALKWPIGPGNMLVFKDPDGKHFYEKSLGWSPYEGVSFREFTLEVEPIKTELVPEDKSQSTGVEKDIQELKAQIAALMELVKSKPQNYYKKGDK